MSSTGSGGAARGRGRGGPRSGRAETASVAGGDMASITSSMTRMTVSTHPSEEISVGSIETEASDRALVPIVKRLMERPNFGNIGAKIPLEANYYEMKVNREICIHRYEVTIKDPGRERRVDRDICRVLFWDVAKENLNTFGKLENLVYDDANCLWTKEKLNLPKGVGQKEIMKTTARGEERVAYVMELKYTNSFLVDLTIDMESSRCVSVQFLDSLLTQSIRCPLRDISSQYYPFGRSVYIIPTQNRGWTVPVGGGIEAWTGLHGAVKIDTAGHALFNADVSTTAFYKIHITMIDFFLEVLNEFRGRRPSEFTVRELREAGGIAMNETQRRSLKRALTGVCLRMTYGPERYRMRDFKFVDVLQPANVVRFMYRNAEDPNDPGREVTVEEYFARYKDIRLHFPHLPVIHVGPRSRNIFVPMELLIIADKPQKLKRELTDFQKAKLIRGAAMEPKVRKQRIDTVVADQGLQDDIFLRNFQVSISPDMIHLDGRVLDPPKLELSTSDEGEIFHIEVDNGKWPLRNMFTSSPKDVVFGVICVDRAIEIGDFWNPYRNLTEACQLFGMKFLTTDPLLGEWDSREQDRDMLRRVVHHMMEDCRKRFRGEANLHILFVMASRNAHIYGTIKTACDLEEGAACQVILSKTFRNMRSSRPETNATAHNIILKMNVKLGGINNKVHQGYNVWPKFTNRDDPTIFIGVDVTHPRPGKQGNSIATVVGSVSLDAARYEASIKVQLPKAERIVYLVDAVRERLLAFYKAVGVSPKHIIIYRDGISESEFLHTLREELASVKAACKKLDPDYNPTVSYVIVQKRHHTRFFIEPSVASKFGNLRESKGNIPPGTVVDTRVTSSQLFDFFLCSHLGAIGTSRPSHYYVLYDSWELTADEWQHLTFALCHLYARCNRSVSIPAPVYYAHLACYRASVHDETLFGGRSSSESRPAGRSEQETTRTVQAALAVNAASPKMYFI